ncbi:hypothetical protein WJX82_009803 [Trebouxia sp. C0006]
MVHCTAAPVKTAYTRSGLQLTAIGTSDAVVAEHKPVSSGASVVEQYVSSGAIVVKSILSLPVLPGA